MFEQYGQRMGIGDYWVSFLACVGASFFGMIVLVIASFLQSSFFILVSILVLLGSSIYIRVAQMQRCNDIGWPWQIPWLVFGIGLVLTLMAQLSVIFALMALPVMILVGLSDFGFGILIGCIPSKQIIQPEYDPQAYRDAYRDYGAPNYSAELAAEAEVRQKLGITTAPPAQSASGKGVASTTRSEPEAPPPRALGFGRKGVLG